MSKQKTHGFFQRPNPSGQASFLMAHRGEKPACEDMHKRSSPRVGRPQSAGNSMHLQPRGYKTRITLSKVWKEPQR